MYSPSGFHSGVPEALAVEAGLDEDVAHRPVDRVGPLGDVLEPVLGEPLVRREVLVRVGIPQVRVDDDGDHEAAPLDAVERAARSSRAAARSHTVRLTIAALYREYTPGTSARS